MEAGEGREVRAKVSWAVGEERRPGAPSPIPSPFPRAGRGGERSAGESTRKPSDQFLRERSKVEGRARRGGGRVRCCREGADPGPSLRRPRRGTA